MIRLPLYFSLMLIITLLLFSFSPAIFTRLKPNDELIKYRSPSNGKNHFRIRNISETSTKIDSVVIDWGYYKTTAHYHEYLLPGRDFSFDIHLKQIILRKVSKQVKFRVYQSHPASLNLYYNSNPKRIPLYSNQNYSEGSLDKYVLTGVKPLNGYRNPIKIYTFLGTDSGGRDIWTRIVYGTGIIIKIVLLSLLISVPISVLTGLFTGYYHNLASYSIEMISNFVTSLPVFLLAMLVVMIFEQKIIYIVIAFSLVQWVEIQKMIKTKINSLRAKEFITAAKLFGKSDIMILLSDILILCLPEIIIGAIFLAKRMILIEASLSFLGYSVEIPNPSWGAILASNRADIYHHLWISLPPTVMIILTLLTMNYLENYFRNKYRKNA